jgi:hypothetical protein
MIACNVVGMTTYSLVEGEYTSLGRTESVYFGRGLTVCFVRRANA